MQEVPMFRKIRRKLVRLAFVSGAGAAATYFFDPERGVERREQAKQKILRRQSATTPDWQSSSANGFDTPVSATSTPPAPASATASPTDITATTTPVDVLVAEPGPVTTP
jgi:hypothetical protein